MEPIKLYLREINKIPLLSFEDETRLAKRIKKGDNRAKKKIVQANLRLVINIAKRYGYLGVPMMDLIEEGNLGLIKAAERYNPKRGYRFSTYAAWWVRQCVLRAIADQGKTIRIPVYMADMMRKYKKAIEELSHRLKRSPTPKEIAKHMRISADKVVEISQCVIAEPYSLERPIGEEGEGEFIDIIEDESIVSPAEEVGRFLRQERIAHLLGRLGDRERSMLSLRYGLKDGVARTLEDVAGKFHVTRERVRQIEKAAFNKLRLWIAKEGRP